MSNGSESYIPTVCQAPDIAFIDFFLHVCENLTAINQQVRNFFGEYDALFELNLLDKMIAIFNIKLNFPSALQINGFEPNGNSGEGTRKTLGSSENPLLGKQVITPKESLSNGSENHEIYGSYLAPLSPFFLGSKHSDCQPLPAFETQYRLIEKSNCFIQIFKVQNKFNSIFWRSLGGNSRADFYSINADSTMQYEYAKKTCLPQRQTGLFENFTNKYHTLPRQHLDSTIQSEGNSEDLKKSSNNHEDNYSEVAVLGVERMVGLFAPSVHDDLIVDSLSNYSFVGNSKDNAGCKSTESDPDTKAGRLNHEINSAMEIIVNSLEKKFEALKTRVEEGDICLNDERLRDIIIHFDDELREQYIRSLNLQGG